MEFVCQLDYPHWIYVTRTGHEGEEFEKGKTTTMATSGCGLCSAVMMAHQLIPNCQFELQDALDLSYEVKGNQKKGTDYNIYGPALAEKLNLRYEHSTDIEDLIRCLRTGGCPICIAAKGIFTKGGHVMTVIAEEHDGRLVILDPSFRPDKYTTPEAREQVEIKYDYLVLCDKEVLARECAPKGTPYHLFWRK
jgi:hypothetical protein